MVSDQDFTKLITNPFVTIHIILRGVQYADIRF